MRLWIPRTRLLGALSCALSLPLSFTLGLACNGDDVVQESAGECPVGSVDCPCTQGLGCDDGLSCQADRCVADPVGTASETGTGTGTGTASASGELRRLAATRWTLRGWTGGERS